jgi:MFS family permease
MVNEYWITRRGMAYGVLCSAGGVSGAVMPFVVQTLLDSYGYRNTLRIVAVGLAILTVPLVPFFKGRLPHSEQTSNPRIDWSFFKSPIFWLYSLSNLFQGFGYFYPALYLPSYATSLDLTGKSGAVLLAAMSVSQVAGQFVFGYLSDRRVSVDVLACTSTVVAAVVSLFMWRLATSMPVLVGFAILYGFFGSGFTAVWARMSTAITDDVISSPIVFSLLNLGKGIGNVLTGPIGGLLVYNNSALQHSSAAAGLTYSSYRWVIILTGACMCASACTVGLRYPKRVFQRVFTRDI